MTPERLAQIEEQWAPNVGPPLNGRQTVLELVAALREAQTALERVREIHHIDDAGSGWCIGCWEGGGEDGAASWPCPTIRALDGGQAEAIPNSSNSK